MANETLSPDGIVEQTNLTGSLSDITDDPDSPDANWLTYNTETSDTVLRVNFPTPTDDLTLGADLQEFRILWRPTSGNTPDRVQVHLYNSGTIVTANLVDITNPNSQQVLSATWDATDLPEAVRHGAGVQVRIVTTADTSPGSQISTGEIGAVEWNVTYSTAGASIDADAGSYSYTGGAATGAEALTMDAAAGAYSYTGSQ